MPRILIVDDEPILRATLQEFLENERFEAVPAASGEEALAKASATDFDVAICDVQMPGMDGLELLNRLRQISPQTFVLIITAYATVENAVEAFQAGAHDYLMKPVLFDDLLHKLRHVIQYREVCRENESLRRQLHQTVERDRIIGSSAAMRSMFETVRKVAATRSNVLLVGESGTGKELVARAIHDSSADHAKKFLAVNCAAIPHDLMESQLFGHRRGSFTGADREQQGLFASVGEGTVFLDEISELATGTQAKLLRAIEQKEVLPVGATDPVAVKCRVIAASNRELAKEVEAGRFRADLFYRLDVVSIRLPPLRERREDIPELVEFFVAKHSREMGKRISGVDHATMRLLMTATWRGNVRELENAIQRAVIMCEGSIIVPHDLPPLLAGTPALPQVSDDLRSALRSYECIHLERVLAECPDKREAARRLGMGLSSLYRKLEEHGLKG
jgi:DNA-binding NtrC family response regulator